MAHTVSYQAERLNQWAIILISKHRTSNTQHEPKSTGPPTHTSGHAQDHRGTQAAMHGTTNAEPATSSTEPAMHHVSNNVQDQRCTDGINFTNSTESKRRARTSHKKKIQQRQVDAIVIRDAIATSMQQDI